MKSEFHSVCTPWNWLKKVLKELADSVRGALTETHGCHGRIRGGFSAGTTTVQTGNDIVRRHRLSRSVKKTAWVTLEEVLPTGPKLQDDTPVKLYKLVNYVKRLAFFLTSGSNLHYTTISLSLWQILADYAQ